MKKIFIVIITIFCLGLLWLLGSTFLGLKKDKVENTDHANTVANDLPKPDVQNMTYRIEGNYFTLVDGVYPNASSFLPKGSNNGSNSALPDEGSPSTGSNGEVLSVNKKVTIVGESAYGDIDEDGDIDAAVSLLVHDNETNEDLYYASLVMNNENEDTSTSAVLLGDNIAPESIVINNSEATYEFLDNEPNQPTDSSPTEEEVVVVDYNEETEDITQVEGGGGGGVDISEIPISERTVDMKSWLWLYTHRANGPQTTPESFQKFTLNLTSQNTFTASADCNVVGGTYSAENGVITFNALQGDLYCSRSEEGYFWEIIDKSDTYSFNDNNQLIFNFGNSGDYAVFK